MFNNCQVSSCPCLVFLEIAVSRGHAFQIWCMCPHTHTHALSKHTVLMISLEQRYLLDFCIFGLQVYVQYNDKETTKLWAGGRQRSSAVAIGALVPGRSVLNFIFEKEKEILKTSEKTEVKQNIEKTMQWVYGYMCTYLGVIWQRLQII